MDYDGEFRFELRLCAWAERAWPPETSLDSDRVALVGRQVGTRRRRWDTVVAIGKREALTRRASFGPETLDANLLRVLRNSPAEWTWYRDALPQWADWRYVREHVHRAADRALLDRRRRNGRIEIRRTERYPDWCERLIAIENKPDLDASAAADLQSQIQRDVAMGLADEVWIATRSTDETVEPGLLTDRPVEAGVLGLDPTTLETSVLWHPRSLSVDAPGTRILERPTGNHYDNSAARFEYVAPEEKARRRRVLAERVYGRGWRSFVDSMRPDCRHFGLDARDRQLLPTCAAKGCLPESRECSGDCPAFEPEPPAWRTRGWPIDGGPGRRQQRLLDERRRRRRPGLSEE